ncbi:hypothetical protein DPMN_164109 [Dreissena polymorpha]|uniref:Uncharacterized protein n=1 Tax=Dreissena polymorpha TaxID=45954 RepID=A0A9D4EX44_DREPO|nr:hypothetical protein DPMN_164109 [Dreissena polymorpha]
MSLSPPVVSLVAHWSPVDVQDVIREPRSLPSSCEAASYVLQPLPAAAVQTR